MAFQIRERSIILQIHKLKSKAVPQKEVILKRQRAFFVKNCYCIIKLLRELRVHGRYLGCDEHAVLK